MHKHHVLDHPQDEMKPRFTMKIVKVHQSALTRQIHEAVLIQLNEDKVLNSKGQYNRCQLPRLTVRMGERVIEDRGDQVQDNTQFLNNLRRGQKREKNSEVHQTENPRKKRRTSDKVSYRAGEAATQSVKRKRLLNEEDIYPERLTKSPRKNITEGNRDGKPAKTNDDTNTNTNTGIETKPKTITNNESVKHRSIVPKTEKISKISEYFTKGKKVRDNQNAKTNTNTESSTRENIIQNLQIKDPNHLPETEESVNIKAKPGLNKTVSPTKPKPKPS